MCVVEIIAQNVYVSITTYIGTQIIAQVGRCVGENVSITTYIGTQIIAQWVGVFVLKMSQSLLILQPEL